MKKIFVLLWITIFLISCAPPKLTAAPTEIPQTQPALSSPSQIIEVQTGETFNIVLNANPTTGYHWEIVGGLKHVEFVSKDYQPSQPITIGSGGVDVWTFKAVSSGETQITLGYFPPDINVAEPDQTVTFQIMVK